MDGKGRAPAASATAAAADYWMTPLELSEETKIAVATLAVWRCRGRGPRFQKMGRLVRYKRSWIDSWLAESAADPNGQM